MTVEIDVSLAPGTIRGVPFPVTAIDVTPISGPCKLSGWSFRDATGDIPFNVSGTVVSPGALATIATTAAVPAGTYLINWTVFLQGAAAAADANNFRLVDSAGNVVASVNLGAAGNYPQNQVEVTTTTAGAVLVQSIGAGTVGVTYGAEISVQPASFPVTVVELQDGNQILGESCMIPNASDTEFLPGSGLHVSGQVKVHVVSGTVTGVLYAIFDKQS